MSIPAICCARLRPYAISSASCSFGARRVSTPTSGNNGFKKSVESTSRMPSSSSTRATAPIRASVFFRGSENSSFASFQSGRMALKILLCFTCPAFPACVTPSWCIKCMVLLSSPRLTQFTRLAAFSSSGEASSFSAMTAISIPWLRAPSNTRNGNRPFPAMSPQPVVLAFVSGMKCAARLLHDAALGSFNKLNQFLHVRRIAQCLFHLCQSLRGVQLRPYQQPVGALKRLQALGRESFTLQADRVDAKTSSLALGNDFRERRDVLRNHC